MHKNRQQHEINIFVVRNSARCAYSRIYHIGWRNYRALLIVKVSLIKTFTQCSEQFHRIIIGVASSPSETSAICDLNDVAERVDLLSFASFRVY